MHQPFLFLLMSLAVQAGEVRTSLHYASPANSVLIEDKGVTLNGEFFPFGREQMIEVTRVQCPDLLVLGSHAEYNGRTRFAIHQGDKIVLVETERMKRSHFFGLLPWLAKRVHSYSLPYRYVQAVLTFAGKRQPEMKFRYINIDYSDDIPELDSEELKNPDLFETPDLKNWLDLRGNEGTNRNMRDVLYPARERR